MLNYYGNAKDEFKEIEYLIKKSDNYNMRLILKAMFVILLILACATNFIEYAAQFKETYIVFTIIFLIIKIISRIFEKYQKIWIYCTSAALFCLSINLSLLIEDQPATIFPVMLMLVSLLFTDEFYPLVLISIVSSLGYVILIQYNKINDIRIFDSYNILVILFISIITRYLIQRNNVEGMKLKVENQKLIQKLNYDAKYDALTTLLNRKAFIDSILDESKEYINTNYGAIAILDIDCFKYINDNYGHIKGDEIIKEVSFVLKRCLIKLDVIGRLGGDEFIICFNRRYNEKEVIEEIKNIIKEVNKISLNKDRNVGVSVGVVNLKYDKIKFIEAYKKADEILYEVKSSGKNSVKESYN